jgi:3-methyladenine DNA glycosylase AlkC
MLKDNKELIALSDQIEEYQNWIVDHPNADYYAKMEVLDKWTQACNKRQHIIMHEMRQLTNEFKN